MKNTMIRLMLLNGLLSWLALGATGCATSKLWEASDIRRRPAADPKVSLLHHAATGMVYVEYDEMDERSKSIQRRCYSLNAVGASPGGIGFHPRFIVRQSLAIPLDQIVRCNGDQPSPAGLCFISNRSGEAFTVYLNGEQLAQAELPNYEYTYRSPGDTAQCIFLTPLAVVGDVAVGAVAVGGFTILEATQSEEAAETLVRSIPHSR